MSDVMQTVVVSVVALGAIAFVGVRVFSGLFRKKAGCPSCASGESGACASTSPRPASAEPELQVHPLVLVKHK
jgi:hypothetical protein